MWSSNYRTTIACCPGPVEAPPPGPVGPHWTLISMNPLRSESGSLEYTEVDGKRSLLALATWLQEGDDGEPIPGLRQGGQEPNKTG